MRNICFGKIALHSTADKHKKENKKKKKSLKLHHLTIAITLSRFYAFKCVQEFEASLY